MDAVVTREEGQSAKEDLPREAFDVWFEADTPYRPDDMKSWIRELVVPEEFEVNRIEESARLDNPRGSPRAHWHCRCTSQQAVDEFAALRVLKLLTAAGFRLLRFDADVAAGAQREEDRANYAPEAVFPGRPRQERTPASERAIIFRAA